MGFNIGKALDPADVFGRRAAKDAAEAQADAANYAADLSAKTQTEMFERGQEATAPWRESGGRALGMLADIYGQRKPQFDAEGNPVLDEDGNQIFEQGDRDAALQSFRGSPAYMNQMSASREGALDAVNSTRDANPRMIEELKRVSSGIADRGYGDYTRGLQSMAGVGQSMAQGTAGQSAQLGQTLGQTYQNQAQQVGQAQAQAVINQANQTSNALQQGASMFSAYRGSQPNHNANAGKHMSQITDYNSVNTVPRY
jgi:hypothetical protein